MRRREFITLLGGAVAAAWPLAAQAQQPERMRRIGVLMNAAAVNSEQQSWLGAFLKALQATGLDRSAATYGLTPAGPRPMPTIRKHAAEFAALAPDVILAPGASTVGPLLQATRTVPIVFPIIVDPVAGGFVDSLARPGGNATGFMLFEYSISGKWLELLKQIAPGVTRVAVLGNPTIPPALPSSASFRPWRRRSGWRSARSTSAMPARSSAPSRPSRDPRMAV